MTVKRKLLDFVWAFVAFCIVLVSIVLLTGQSFFDGAVDWNGNEGVLVLFGTEIVLDRKLPETARKLLYFNDVMLGNGFARRAEKTFGFFMDYVRDGVSLAYGFARAAVGLE